MFPGDIDRAGPRALLPWEGRGPNGTSSSDPILPTMLASPDTSEPMQLGRTKPRRQQCRMRGNLCLYYGKNIFEIL